MLPILTVASVRSFDTLTYLSSSHLNCAYRPSLVAYINGLKQASGALIPQLWTLLQSRQRLYFKSSQHLASQWNHLLSPNRPSHRSSPSRPLLPPPWPGARILPWRSDPTPYIQQKLQQIVVDVQLFKSN